MLFGKKSDGRFSARKLLLDLCRLTDLYVMAPLSESCGLFPEQYWDLAIVLWYRLTPCSHRPCFELILDGTSQMWRQKLHVTFSAIYKCINMTSRQPYLYSKTMTCGSWTLPYVATFLCFSKFACLWVHEWQEKLFCYRFAREYIFHKSYNEKTCGTPITAAYFGKVAALSSTEVTKRGNEGSGEDQWP